MPAEQEVRLYSRPDGVEPYSRWIENLRDSSTRFRIRERISRLRAGNFGDFRSVGGGVQELRIPVGAGIRVYFGRQDESIVILLCGGDKSTQARDIRRAQIFWKDYRSRSNGI
ncbi:MAG: type II toxin-antitoxin system RelE/ParE family toxin [Deltaproteobacteria bacterium]|nr:type II toxin-antitoxin system RelE/ParE family toxin [Deltaproteobacteria bacterium]